MIKHNVGSESVGQFILNEFTLFVQFKLSKEPNFKTFVYSFWKSN